MCVFVFVCVCACVCACASALNPLPIDLSACLSIYLLLFLCLFLYLYLAPTWSSARVGGPPAGDRCHFRLEMACAPPAIAPVARRFFSAAPAVSALVLETSRYQTQGDDNETRVMRWKRKFTQHRSLKSWSRCCKQQPEALDLQDVLEAQAPRLHKILLHSHGFLSIGSGGVKARAATSSRRGL